MMSGKAIVLKRGQHSERVLYKIDHGENLLLKLHSSLVGVEVKIFCNYPQQLEKDKSRLFNRHEYYELPWLYEGKDSALAEVDGYAKIHIGLSGSFRFYCALPTSGYKEEVCSGFFVVDPLIQVPSSSGDSTASGRPVSIDGICMQTVVTKSLGDIKDWRERLRVSKETNYNIIHFTPVQHLGASDSAYSIKDQLSVDPRYDGSKEAWANVKKVVDEMKRDWGVLSITDVVLNHTSFDSDWIFEHPEAGFNLVNSPHLKPAFVLDRLLWKLTLDIADSKYKQKGILNTPVTSESLEKIRRLFLEEVLPNYQIVDYFLADVDKLKRQFETKVRDMIDAPARQPSDVGIHLIQDETYSLFGCTVDLDAAVSKFYVQRENLTDYGLLIDAAVKQFEVHVKELNKQKRERIQQFLKDAVGNCIASAGYHFLDPNGPKYPKISEATPIVWRYFTEHPFEKLTCEQEIAAIEDASVARHFKASNGWIMGDDPLRNFAEPGSLVYLKRELIVWGDSVKLRFGKCREDNPYLWDRIAKYCETTAQVFDGIRLDNCHSTPLHVAEFAVDICRGVKPNFYVMAELFTGREDIDMIFVNRLGITSLIREAMSTYSCQELGRQIHRYGGRPVGAFYPSKIDTLLPSLPHALFMDYTHDNQPSAVQKRHPVDLLASAAAVAMGCYGVGSSWGYDTMVPHYIDIVKERRLYPKWTNEDSERAGDTEVGSHSGIISGKRLLNELHASMADASNLFNQVYVDQVTPEVITVTRHNSESHESIIAAIRTAFDPNLNSADPKCADSHNVSCLNIPGQITEIILEASTVENVYKTLKSKGKLNVDDFARHPNVLNGLHDWKVVLSKNIQLSQSSMVKLKFGDSTSSNSRLTFKHFPPGSVIVFRVSLSEDVRKSLGSLQSTLNSLQAESFPNMSQVGGGGELFDFSSLSLVDMNRLLFRCGAEEMSDGLGIGPYNLPGYGDIKFCGIAGLKYVMDEAAPSDNLGHALFENVRNGDWLMDYTVNRLKLHSGTKQIGLWMGSVFVEMKKLPRYLIPAYFECFVRLVYNQCVKHIVHKLKGIDSLADWREDMLGSLKTKLLLGSVQLVGVCKTASLAPVLLESGSTFAGEDAPSLSAGLPHFSEGIWRNWGRDTFIALRGLLVLTNRLQEARTIILSYASTMRHGLIPNLLGGGGEVARYNCRDAFWWWLNSIRHLCLNSAPDEVKSLLQQKVARIYPHDNSQYQPVSSSSVFNSLAEIMQEGLQRHAEGISFRERNAGPQIDSNMTSAGFTVEVYVDPATGFVIGGNKWNCGTWMDKMGSSDRAQNRGVPATPRDGASVELQGLCYACVSWLSQLSRDKNLYPFTSVKVKESSEMTFEQWANKLRASFDNHFFIDASSDNARYHDVSLVNKKHIYKDTLGSQNPWTDYQLRPNYALAIAEAPALCKQENAWKSLEVMHTNLLGPLGMKTLDPSDWKYNGVYDNDRDDNNCDLAKGFNYHNGPEWVWLAGFFFRAKLFVSKQRSLNVEETKQAIAQHLARLREHVDSSPWRGVTELTNQNGQFCPFSSPTQAWSFATALELIHDLNVN